MFGLALATLRGRVVGFTASFLILWAYRLVGWIPARLSPVSGYLAAQQSERELNAWVNYLLLGVISAYIAVAVVNTLVMATGERAREFALLRVVGTTRRQLLAMLRWEALFIGGLALVMGGIGVLIAIVPFSAVLAGSPIPYVPPLVGFGIVAFTLLVTLGAMLVPARIALRTPPTEALSGPR